MKYEPLGNTPKSNVPSLLVVRAAGDPPGFFPSLTSTPLRGAPAQLSATTKSARKTSTVETLRVVETRFSFLMRNHPPLGLHQAIGGYHFETKLSESGPRSA